MIQLASQRHYSICKFKLCLQFDASDQIFFRALLQSKSGRIFRFAILERFQIELVRQTRFVWDAFQRRLIQMKSGDVISRRDLKRQRVDGKARKSIALALQFFFTGGAGSA